MAAEESYARLGLFVVVGVIVMLATGLFFVQRMRSREVIPLVTYFTEDVTGLDISSPVRYRGVAIGRVSNVRVRPDGDIVAVEFELFHDRLTTIGENVTRIRELADLPSAARLRAQFVGNLVTGEGYLLLDLPKDPPPSPVLTFEPPRGYVPSIPSPLAAAQQRLPEVLDAAQETLHTLREIVAQVPDSLERTDRFFANVERILRESELPALSADLRTFSTSTTGQMAQIASNMERLVGTESSLIKFAEEARSAIRDADVSASSQATREAADRTILATDELRRSLPAMRETLALLRELTRHLDEQPESVIFGPRPPEAKGR